MGEPPVGCTTEPFDKMRKVATVNLDEFEPGLGAAGAALFVIVETSVIVMDVVLVDTTVVVVTFDELELGAPVLSMFRPEIVIGVEPVLFNITSKVVGYISVPVTSERLSPMGVATFHHGCEVMFWIKEPGAASEPFQELEGMETPCTAVTIWNSCFPDELETSTVGVTPITNPAEESVCTTVPPFERLTTIWFMGTLAV